MLSQVNMLKYSITNKNVYAKSKTTPRNVFLS
jgi:hypothetical protein